MRIESVLTEEEAAAIMVALEILHESSGDAPPSVKRSRWRLAGLLGHPVPSGMDLEGSLWAYRGGEGQG